MASRTIPVVPGFQRAEHRFGDHDLQVLSVWTPDTPQPSDNGSKLWTVYVHGGAWRDPAITNTSFIPTISRLVSESPDLVADRIAGFVSIEYRLSPHPNFPQDPAATPPAQLRAATHPSHILDVRAALSLLEDKYAIGDRYVLLGHSCGATLAFQAVMSADLLEGGAVTPYAAPRAVLGVCGIYDMRLIRDNHRDVPIYEEVMRGAFGDDEERWDRASPARFTGFERSWNTGGAGRVAILASSKGDGLIEDAQIEVMQKQLQDCKNIKLVMQKNSLVGTHDEVWETGYELAQLVRLIFENV